jgi:small-conductance mechanosensitive channel
MFGTVDWMAAWAWAWPILALGAWLVACTYGLRRFFVWYERRFIDGRPGESRMVRWFYLLAHLGTTTAGLYALAWFAPVPDFVRAFLASEVQPWVWYSLGLIAWIIGGVILTRRSVKLLVAQAARTKTELDDALAAAIRRPLYLVILVLGVNVWVLAVPLGARAWQVMERLNTGAGLFAILLFLDSFIAAYVTSRAATSRVLATSGPVLKSTARVLIVIVGSLMLLDSVGVDMTPILASLGVGSLAIGLALQKALEDFLSGLLIAADQPIRVGDFIEVVGDEAGTVLSIGWRTTRIRTRDDMVVIFPNSKLSTSTVINRSMPGNQVEFTINVGVAYHSDLEQVAAAATDVAKTLQDGDPRGTDGYDPKLVYVGFGDSSVDFRVWLKATRWEHTFSLRDAYIRALHARFKTEGITIPFPMRTLDIPPDLVAQLTSRSDA